MTSENKAEFQLGFAMSGAISAGAYTAGVLDFFIQALEEWEHLRGQDGVPAHRTGIKVIAGASAGAMTGALGALGLAHKQNPRPFEHPLAGKQLYKCYLPSLYDTWVVHPNMLAQEGWPGFLSTEDLDKRTPEGKRSAVVSALNSVLLDRIRDSVLSQQGELVTRPYVAKTLHVYMTVTNTRGVPYQIEFGNGGLYNMMMHGDRAHYQVTGLGTWETVSAFGDADSSRTIDVSTLSGEGGPGEGWKQYANHALASGAFPVGLSARPVETQLADYAGRQWPVQEAIRFTRVIEPDWPDDWRVGTGAAAYDGKLPYNFVAVDGGVFNNDPMEYARFALREKREDPNPQGKEEADRAVVMITPFPEPPDFSSSNEMNLQLTSVLSALFPALKNQARFKLPELIMAQEESIRSRYMIVPRRVPPVGQTPEPYSLASGLLEGFGGFFSQKLRDHDFQLGRRNCQRFLAATLTLAPENKLTKASRANGPGPGLSADGSLPVIPLLGTALPEVPYPDWAMMTLKEVDSLMVPLLRRLERVGTRLILSQFSSRWLRISLRLAKWLANRPQRAPYYIRWAILSELIQRNQIEEWKLPEDWKGLNPAQVRLVWAALASPAYDYRSAAALAGATGVPEAAVLAILEKSRTAKGMTYRVVRAPFRWRTRYYSFKEKTGGLPIAHWIPLWRHIYSWFARPLRLDNAVPPAAQPAPAVQTVEPGKV
jgi:hypothetical protein